ncbi:hypothetical protein BESB_048140 [Besnoitia besnoiti]|uniref:UDP-N-acetylglucosamine diphosphorylase n=1 Tax=Besnoitia besnoiti TaxID=94643 RepID=A0A2A9MM80_BESBE|nr:hypothetical protein BESB_048140 [Besnoitia besnoiti]PFH36622.1 hypothetical protein BESB_048140 [Besnoitia besnoiti]
MHVEREDSAFSSFSSESFPSLSRTSSSSFSDCPPPGAASPAEPPCLDTLRCLYTSAQQDHLLDFHPRLSHADQKLLLHQLSRHDAVRVSRIFRRALRRHQAKAAAESAAKLLEAQASRTVSAAEEAGKHELTQALDAPGAPAGAPAPSPSLRTKECAECSLSVSPIVAPSPSVLSAESAQVAAPADEATAATGEERSNAASLAVSAARASAQSFASVAARAALEAELTLAAPLIGKRMKTEEPLRSVQPARPPAGAGGGNETEHEDEDDLHELPSRCCRETCFPPDIIEWGETAEDAHKGEAQHANDASEEDTDAMQARLARLYSLVEQSSCPLVRLEAMPDRARRHWYSLGLKLIREGRVAALVLAGGDGTRLAFAGPKGQLPVAPLSGKSLFQLFAERVKRLCELAEREGEAESRTSAAERVESTGMPRPQPRLVSLPLLIMTSEGNDTQTRAFFAQHNFFGLHPSSVYFFLQESMPTFSPDGHILLREPGCMYTAPNGNGGVFSALESAGLLRELRERGVVGLQVCSVDNILARIGDPLFFGLCFESHTPVGNKVLRRRDPYEKVGVVCQVLSQAPPTHAERSRLKEALLHSFAATGGDRSADASRVREAEAREKDGGSPREGRSARECKKKAATASGEARSHPERNGDGRRRIPVVIEYSELPDEIRLARKSPAETQQDQATDLLFEWGNACLHYFDLRFIHAVLTNRRLLDSSYHLALKNVNAILPRRAGAAREGAGPTAETRPNGHARTGEGDLSKDFVRVEKGWKLELFIFDVFALASRVLCVEVARSAEFSPIKNKSPNPNPRTVSDVVEDTLFSAQRDLSRLHRSWLRCAGVRADTHDAQPLRSPDQRDDDLEREISAQRAGADGGKGDEADRAEAEVGFQETLCEISPLVSYGGEALSEAVAEGRLASRVGLPFRFEG